MAFRNTKSLAVPSTRVVLLCLLISVTACCIPSCAVTDFVATYFNTYYNAQTLFNQAEAEVMTQLDSRPGGRTWLGMFGIQATTRTKLESVIEKCSKLLQYHPDSKLVDDALLMIGKAYYYQDDNQQAIRKFNEIISEYPTGTCAIEAKLLLSYAQYRMNTRDDARKTALEVVDVAKKNDAPEMTSRASLVLGQMAQEDKDYSSAREYFDQAAQFGSTPEERSSASLMSAEMYRKMEKYKDAEDAYRRAEKSSNHYAGEYRGKIGALRMIERQERYDGALAGLRLLRADAKNKEFFGEIEIEVANTYRDMGNLPKAVSHYTLVDTLYPRSENSARSYYALGDLYEHTLFRYDSAFVAYTKGKNEFPAAEVTKVCLHRSDYLARYFQYFNEIVRCDTILAALRASRDTAKTQSPLPAVNDSLRAQGSPRVVAPPPMTADSAEARRETAMNEMAGLFYATIGLPDSAQYWYMRIVKEYPAGRDIPRALYTLAQIYAGRDSVGSKPVVDSLYRDIVARFPSSEFAPDARRLLRLPPATPTVDAAEKAYQTAEGLMISGDSTRAAEGFTKLAREYPSSPLASRALYAAGWIYENRLFNRDSAVASYTKLLALYPGSQYATRVAPKIAEVNLKLKQDAAQDSLATRRTVAPSAPPPVRPVPAVPDSAAERVFVPKPGSTIPDSMEVRRIPTIAPRKLPQKEGPTP